MMADQISAYAGVIDFCMAACSVPLLFGYSGFLRINSVAAWIFFCAFSGMVPWCCCYCGWLPYRMKVKEWNSGSGWIDFQMLMKTDWPDMFFLIIFLFLIPYVGIQYKALQSLMDAAFSRIFRGLGLVSRDCFKYVDLQMNRWIKRPSFLVMHSGFYFYWPYIWIIGWACLSHFGGMDHV